MIIIAKVLLIVVACALFDGCATTQPDPRVVAFEAGKKQVQVDKRVLADCPELGKLKGKTEEEALAIVAELTAKYKECRSWKAEANRVMKDAFNLQDEKKGK